MQAFSNTVYPILRDNCGSCHSDDRGYGQNPQHAHSDTGIAHNNALQKVSLNDPKNSKLYRRLSLEAHNCWSTCSSNAATMLSAIEAWAGAIADQIPRSAPTITGPVSENQVESWIAADRTALASGDRQFIKYVSLHELHNDSEFSAEDLNVARAGISKILNSTARFAPEVVNPADVSAGNGMVYRFDIRDYWGYSQGETEIIFGGPDDDVFFGNRRDLLTRRSRNTGAVRQNTSIALASWERITKGNFEALDNAKNTPNIDGFKTNYVEASQLAYTLSRPDVYNAIMQIPMYGNYLQDELRVDTSKGTDSFDYSIVDEAITIEPRLLWRGDIPAGYYYKTTDIFSGQGQQFPFYDHPVPKFISNFGGGFGGGQSYSFVASLAQPQNDDGSFSTNRTYTGESGLQQSAQEVIWSMPNGLQGYAIFGGLDQRRTDAFTFIVRDPRRGHTQRSSRGGFGFFGPRLLNGASCMGCHENGLNWLPNNLRDKLDTGQLSQSWTRDSAAVARVKELYPTTEEWRDIVDDDRRFFTVAMQIIRQGMILGNDKNLYEEPIAKLFEKAQYKYSYAETTGN